MRLFVALALPDPIKDVLEMLQYTLEKNGGVQLRFTHRDQLHLTVQFLGEVALEQLPALKKALQSVQYKPFELSLGALGVFPNKKDIRVVFVDTVGQEVVKLAQHIAEATAPFVEQAKRDFVSHITLARVKKLQNSQVLLSALENSTVPKLSFPVTHFVLKESKVSPEDGVQHTAIEEYIL